MRVGVYIDGFNLYYGGRAVMGRSQPGWRWLDLRRLSQRLIDERQDWIRRNAVLDRVVYCTALVDKSSNPDGRQDQDTYIRALELSHSIDLLVKGRFMSHVKTAPLATKGPDGKPVLVRPDGPVMVRDLDWADITDAVFMVSHRRFEEKGTDVNVASHLLLDVLGQHVDAAIVISNDSDLKLPIQESRLRIPVGTVNPGQRWLAGDLKGTANDGVGGHWWRKLNAQDLTSCQLPDPVATISKPTGW